MIRWRFLAFRLFIVLAALMLLRWTAGPAAHWFLVTTIQSSTGSHVEIASTEVGFFPPRLHLSNMTVADPRKEMKNLFELEDIYLAIDGAALLRRKYEVANGRIRGIRVGTNRAESGWLEVVDEEPSDQPTGPSMIEQWTDKLTDDAESRIDSFVNELQTVSQSERIRNDWKAEYAQLRERANQLEDDIRSIKATIRKVDNPLRDLPAMQETLQKVENLRNELVSVRQKLDTLPTRVRDDLEALQAAKRADQQRLSAYLPVDVSSNSPATIGPELLGHIVREHLQTVRAYLDSGRSIAKVTFATPKADRQRGENILFGEEGPAWLIRRCEIDGFLHVNDDEYNLLGIVENITSDTENLQDPLHARLRLDGPRVVRIDFQRNYDSPIPRDHLKIHWPNLDLPNRDLGNQKSALAVNGGQLQMWVDIYAQGDEIEGRLVSKQTGTRLDLVTEPKLESNVIVQAVRRKLREIDYVDVDARFAGTWKQMDLKINTSLTSQVSDTVQAVLQDTMLAARAKISSEVERVYEKESAELSTWLTQQQADARQMLAGVDTAIDTVSKSVMSELSASDAYLSRLRTGVGRVLK